MANKDHCLVLLGAGASVEAGLQTSNGLTSALLNRSYEADGIEPFFKRLFYLVSGSILHVNAARGINPLTAGISIEDIANAIDFLKNRKFWPLRTLFGDASPDISDMERNYYEYLQAMTYRLPLQSPYQIYEEDHIYLRENKIENWRLSNAYESQGLYGLGYLFLKRFVFSSLQTNTSRLAYLSPLVNSSRVIGIITLNYDTCLESSFNINENQYQLGIEDWRPGRLNLTTDRMPLLKLHGSLDWVWPRLATSHAGIRVGKPAMGLLNDETCFIFGGENKLTSDGPFLDLLKAFEKLLDRINLIYIVGYSFSDPHINSLLKNWTLQDSVNRMVVANGREWLKPHDQKQLFIQNWPSISAEDMTFLPADEALREWFG